MRVCGLCWLCDRASAGAAGVPETVGALAYQFGEPTLESAIFSAFRQGVVRVQTNCLMAAQSQRLTRTIATFNANKQCENT